MAGPNPMLPGRVQQLRDALLFYLSELIWPTHRDLHSLCVVTDAHSCTHRRQGLE
jgi:hypothetical protein